ncbi:MAG: hypothetical protein WC795_00890 [Candidatus Paceibacterota bacterium]|jgi:hypothetical protein
MNWAVKRQLFFISIFLGLIMLIIGILAVPKLIAKPTCTDTKQNGTEAGIDCGGECPNFCPFEVNSAIVLWARSFQSSTNTYNAVAYIENQNSNAAIKSIPYEFKIYDENSIIITSRKGIAFIPPNGRTPIFESTISVGNRTPVRTSFEFIGKLDWIKVDSHIIENLPIVSRDNNLINIDTTPKLTSTIVNNSFYDLFDVEVVAILYNADGNAIAASKTVIDSLAKSSSVPVFFTWSKPFGDTISTIEVIPRINIFSVAF